MRDGDELTADDNQADRLEVVAAWVNRSNPATVRQSSSTTSKELALDLELVARREEHADRFGSDAVWHVYDAGAVEVYKTRSEHNLLIWLDGYKERQRRTVAAVTGLSVVGCGHGNSRGGGRTRSSVGIGAADGNALRGARRRGWSNQLRGC